MLGMKRVDMVVASELAFNSQIKRLKLVPGDFIPVLRMDELSTDAYLAFSRGTPEDLVMQFRESFARTHASGRYIEILEQHGYR